MTIPINIEFSIHRLNEFMMLMLGETILSITIAPLPDASSTTATDEHYGRAGHHAHLHARLRHLPLYDLFLQRDGAPPLG